MYFDKIYDNKLVTKNRISKPMAMYFVYFDIF